MKMQPMNPRLACLAAILALTGASCNRAVSQNASAAGPETKAVNPLEIEATDALMQRVKLGAPSVSEVGGSLSVAARVEVDDTRIARVGSSVMGRLTQFDVREGQEVSAGQVLAVTGSSAT